MSRATLIPLNDNNRSGMAVPYRDHHNHLLIDDPDNKCELINTSSLIRDALKEASPLLTPKNIELIFSFHGSSIGRVFGVELWLKSAIQHCILSSTFNAKTTSKIYVSARQYNKHISIIIRNFNLDFEASLQANEEKKKQCEKTGNTNIYYTDFSKNKPTNGLAGWVMKQHGGCMSSVKNGAGSEFILKIPTESGERLKPAKNVKNLHQMTLWL